MRLKYSDSQHAYWLDGVRCKGVTTCAKIPDDTWALDQWRKRMVAVGMAVSPPLVERAAAHFDDRDQLDQIAEEAMVAARSHEAAARGTAAHRITERIDLGGPVIDTPLAQAVSAAWNAALDRAGLDIVPEYVERIVVYPEQRICGRFDRYARRRSDGRLVVVDLKTGANAVRYPHAIAVQMAMYAHAPLLAGPLPPSGGTTDVFEPLPAGLDREHGVVIHMPAEDKAEVVEIDIAAGWEATQKIVFPTLEWRNRRDLTRPLDELLEQRKNWLKARIRALPDEPKTELARTWPNGVGRTVRDLARHDHINQIAGALDRVESAHELPFGTADPAAPPLVHKPKKAS